MEEITEEQILKIGNQILTASRTELYLHMRFLDLALSGLAYKLQPATLFMGTDGVHLFYDPEKLIDRYRKNRVLINRGYLHLIFHCIFRHLWKPRREDRALWDLACDIAMEHILDGLPHRSVKLPLSWYRQNFYETMRAKLKVPTAEGIYRMLEELRMPLWEQERLEREFRIDDHSFWPDPDRKPPAGTPSAQQKWDDISRKMQTDMETASQDPGKQSEAVLQQVKVENRERYDYRRFLRKFAVLREEPHLDPETFDPIFYSYGMQLYGNMPLIEPQETREIRKIEDFVIAIDTSMSCSGRLIRAFLEQTYSVLKDTESFFRKINIHIIQCDEAVQADQRITSEEDLRSYMEHFKLIGNGGTDFRPVFRYVDELIEKKAFRKLKGLIYFTDGRGTFPKRRPPYDTAFIFLRDDYTDADVPPWAMKLILEPDDLGDTEETTRDFNNDDWEELPHYEY